MATEVRTTGNDELEPWDREGYPWDREGYLGDVNIVRPGAVAADRSLSVVRCGDGRLRYYYVTGGVTFQYTLQPTDRRLSMIVVDSEDVDRRQALWAALEADRWRKIAEHGSGVDLR